MRAIEIERASKMKNLQEKNIFLFFWSVFTFFSINFGVKINRKNREMFEIDQCVVGREVNIAKIFKIYTRGCNSIHSFIL